MIAGTPLITPPTISTRLGTASLLAVAGALLLAISTLSAVAYFNQRQALLEDSRFEAKILAENVAAAVLFDDKSAAIETVQTVLAAPTLNLVAVLLPDSRLFVSAASTAADPNLKPARLAGKSYEFSWGQLQLTAPINHQGAVIGHVYVNKSLSQLYQQTLIYSASALGIGSLAMLLAWLAVSRVQKTVTRVEKDLLAMAHIDQVTQLWNRNTFNEHIDALIKQNTPAKKVALLLLDLDNFKTINDKVGHHSGDLLLAIVARRLSHFLGKDDIACRLGGDEFAIVIQRPDESALPLIADSITRLFVHPITVEGQELYVTCSIGISVYPDDAANKDALVHNADTAMYQAKFNGKNSTQFFSLEMREQLNRRAALEAGLRCAIAGNELSLLFQPQFDLRNLRLIGAEVLLRWHSAALGKVSPAEFIPIAEDTGLIVPIGEWVLRSACEQMQIWRNERLQLPVISVNFSARQLRIQNPAQHILDIIAETRVDPHLIEVELTESILMENLHSLVGDFSLLQQRGIKIAIDDFGTGYSSMAYLKRLPLDRIKIDRTFIQDLPHSANDREIVAAMIAMAHNLGLRVTAEGVETEGQADFLRELDCDTVQGFYFGIPMPAAELKNLLMQTSPDTQSS